MKKWLSDIIYSFPVQLFFLHLRNNLLLIGMWIFVVLLLTGTIADLYGVKYLFLSPEYMGEVGFNSFFILGAAFGGFFMTWNLTTYLLDAHHFPFLASMKRPFTKFILNNFIVPLTFLVFYFTYTIWFQRYFEYWTINVIFTNCVGFLLGIVLMLFLSSAYFQFTNKDIFNFAKKRKGKLPPNLIDTISPNRRIDRIHNIKKGTVRWRVDTYLTESFRPRIVRSVQHYDYKLLFSVFKQNHLNALVVQLMSLVALIVMGYLIDYPMFRIPAGASILIMVSIVIALLGAITYWFDGWRTTVFFLLLIGINFLTKFESFNHKNKAYGLDYEMEPAKYTYADLQKVCAVENVNEDKNATIQILENWKKKFPNKEKPKMVLVCVSGGGLRAAAWVMQVLQKSDSLLDGRLFSHTVLTTGASGGMIGASYLRELFLKQQMGEDINIYDSKYIDIISQDLLNSIGFTIVTNDLFLPWAKFNVDGKTYRKDRGYIFEKQLNENTNNAFTKKIKDYKSPEAEAIIPMIFLTPSIVNDGRRMIISSQGVSYMTIPPIGVARPNAVEIDAVDFGRVFAKQGAQDMNFVTGLRMNATYPYILPNVYLPSKPGIEVMDAGFRDNYGINSATRFIHVFKDWILENTNGVVLLQISAQIKVEEIVPNDDQGAIESMLNPLGIAGQILTLQDYEQDTNLGFIFDLLGRDKFEVIRYIYYPKDDMERASISFHLTSKEKKDVLNSYFLKKNDEKFELLKKALE
ncbi:MAG: patatin-like phospholipase family protein [Saprospiraceae bacterium]|nr:patatin-like phospholipase family protein [Saprospiraceae bacterium]MDG2418798.1 patatin-like phospholipase family protein [Saprospiraceae bacterium]